MSGIVLWIGALAVAAALAIGVATVGAAAVEKAQASSAADAAALAGAAAGVDAASRTAQLNGAELLSFSEDRSIYRVVVSVGESTAVAYAERLLVPVETG